MTVMYRILSKAGRGRNGFERDRGTIYHAVPAESVRALCGTEPGYSSVGWSSWPGDTVTCGRCAKALERRAVAR